MDGIIGPAMNRNDCERQSQKPFREGSMSGPKVVRIVTREEIEALCKGHIATFEEAAEELHHYAKRHGLLDDALTADIDSRLQKLRRLFTEERWNELQKQAPLATTFLQTEAASIRARAVAAAEAMRSKARRMADAAKTLASALEAAGHTPAVALRNLALRGHLGTGDELPAMEATLSESFSILAARRNSATASEAQIELARRLGLGERVQSFPEWLATHTAKFDRGDSRLDALMAEIEALDDPATVQQYSKRATSVALEGSPERRALLTDSLILDLSEHSKRRRANEIRAEKLREVRSRLRVLGTQLAKELDTQVAGALQTPAGFDRADELVARAQAIVESETKRLAATARRRAVLEGLAKLGYEVRESMATAWVRDARLIVRKPGATDYGVELGAPRDMSRLQVRLVGSHRPSVLRNAQRDRDMEKIWCSDFGRLQQVLAKDGGEVVIERALDVGVEPVKTVTFVDSELDVRKEQRQITR
jgi:hypothetical protein